VTDHLPPLVPHLIPAGALERVLAEGTRRRRRGVVLGGAAAGAALALGLTLQGFLASGTDRPQVLTQSSPASVPSASCTTDHATRGGELTARQARAKALGLVDRAAYKGPYASEVHPGSLAEARTLVAATGSPSALAGPHAYAQAPEKACVLSVHVLAWGHAPQDVSRWFGFTAVYGVANGKLLLVGTPAKPVDALEYFGPGLYTRPVPSSARPLISQAAALRTFRRAYPLPASPHPHVALRLLTSITHPADQGSLLNELAWYITVAGQSLTEPGDGSLHRACTTSFFVDAMSGRAVGNIQHC
jgi:hypothetical protein